MNDVVDPGGHTARGLLPTAARVFGTHVFDLDEADWGRPTPCADWTVRDLVGHLVAEHRWAPELLAGRTVAEVGDRFDGDLLGDDPAAAWSDAVNLSLQSWLEAGADDRVHLSSGDAPVGEYAEQMLLDLTVHAWDLARATGGDERLDPDCVAHVLGYVTDTQAELTATGLFDDAVPTSAHDPQSRLLAALGRRP